MAREVFETDWIKLELIGEDYTLQPDTLNLPAAAAAVEEDMARLVAAATGAGTPSGTVAFTNGATMLGTATLSGGVATLDTTPFLVGDHTLAAAYSGDDGFLASGATDVTLVVKDSCVIGTEVHEEFVDLVGHLGDSGVGTVDLVDHDYHRKAGLQCLAENEPRLGHRALGGVDQQKDAIHHGQTSLDLSSEVGVTGGIDDVQLDVAVPHGRVLGQDRDPLFAFEIHRVHHPLVDVLSLPEGSGLPEHRVDEGRLAVVHMGHDRDVADVCPCGHEGAGY
jgi:hypothetical protein